MFTEAELTEGTAKSSKLPDFGYILGRSVADQLKYVVRGLLQLAWVQEEESSLKYTFKFRWVPGTVAFEGTVSLKKDTPKIELKLRTALLEKLVGIANEAPNFKTF